MILDPVQLTPFTDPHLLGDLRSWRDVELPGLGRSAEVYAWLPPGYDSSDERYPVVYLHDGHNMFLPQRAYAGVAWDVDRAMTDLARDGIPAVVVAVPCHPTERADEYTQYPLPGEGGGRAPDYAAFLVEHLKPAVDAVLRTRPGPEHTVTAGSSLGGVVSTYLWERHPDVFGGAGVFSPAFWWPGEQALVDLQTSLPERRGGRVYVDVGGRERHDDADIERRYVEDAERLVRVLRGAGVPVRYVFDSQAYHVETAWAERFPSAVRWLLRGYAVAPPAYVVADLARGGTGS
ncbi:MULTISPECIES: alpha/beta hydrolase [unclassified Ornithinimicrobium]|uniref:alpha/beta hydrolase n=1 Tax=unclassified Ornithinimicrobium TaxID=2615080 RepID=UPI0038527463